MAMLRDVRLAISDRTYWSRSSWCSAGLCEGCAMRAPQA
jgi:hypothetical protein